MNEEEKFESLFKLFNDRGALIEKQNKINARLKVENEKMREILEAYCICSSMGSAGGQCCVCDDLEQLETDNKAQE